MDSLPHFPKSFRSRSPVHAPAIEIFCVHCSRSLGAARSVTSRLKKETRHLCAEKLLSREPAAPPPYN